MESNRLWFFEKFIIKKFFAPKLKQKTNFFRLLALAQRSGLWLRDALFSIKRSETNKGLIMIIQDLIDQLTQWYTLSQAMKSHSYFFHGKSSRNIGWDCYRTWKFPKNKLKNKKSNDVSNCTYSLCIYSSNDSIDICYSNNSNDVS